MNTRLYQKDFITTPDWTVEDLNTMIDLAFKLKGDFATGVLHDHILRAKTLYMLFFEESTRTRNSFETGMTQLGGHAIWLTPKATQIGHGENAKDTGMVLSSYGNGIAIRDCRTGVGNQYLYEMAQYADAPIINMQDDVDHPCQAMADLFTLMELFGRDLRGRKFVVSWTYAPKYVRPLSVPQSLVWLMPRFGMDVTVAYPKGYHMMPEVMAKARQFADEAGTTLTETNDMDEAFEGADFLYPEILGPDHGDRGRARSRGDGGAEHRLARDAGEDGAGEEARGLHALHAHRPRPRGGRRCHRRPAVDHLQAGGEPAAHPEGADGADDDGAGLALRRLIMGIDVIRATCCVNYSGGLRFLYTSHGSRSTGHVARVRSTFIHGKRYMILDTVIRGGTLLTPSGPIRADLGIAGEHIAAIGHDLAGGRVIDATGKLVLPGAIDPHVHLQMPAGAVTSSDNWRSGTIAAACGGTTTVIDFVEPEPADVRRGEVASPLRDALAARRAEADGHAVIDFGLHMTLVDASPATLAEIPAVIEAGCTSFKTYLTYAGFKLEDDAFIAALAAVGQGRRDRARSC